MQKGKLVMTDLIIVDAEKCVGCNACVRTCPAPEANITKNLGNGRFVTTVNPAKCIACGECVRNCSHGARDYIDDTKNVMDLINSGRKKVLVIAAPAIKTVFPDNWKCILEWFRTHGCPVFDVSFGADICTWAHLRAIQQKMVGNVISQPCAAIVKYIETYQPTLLRNLSPVHSPMSCGVTYIKKYLHRTDEILALSPCIAKKNEFVETGLVEYNVTFKKLTEWFDRQGIRIGTNSSSDFKYDFSGEQGQMGGIYPRVGGLRDNLWLHDPDINITTSEGVHKVYPELDMYATLPEHKKPEVFDVLSCEFGCNVGAGTGTTRTLFDAMETMREVEKEAKTRRKVSGGFFRGAEDKLFKRFDEELRLNDFLRSYKAGEPTRQPSYAELDSIFNIMGKHTEQERHYNCHACGYKSCMEMATAIFRGLNTADNCIVHAKNVLLAHHSELAQKHEELAEIADKCKELSQRLSSDVDNISDMMGTIRDTNKQTTNRADDVHNLLVSLKAYCDQFDSLDEDSMVQLKAILKTTTDAFNAVNEFVDAADNKTTVVDENVVEIKKLVENVNQILNSVT